MSSSTRLTCLLSYAACLTGALLAACQRGESERGAAASTVEPSESPPPSPAPARSAPRPARCLVALPDTPPPVAHPAARCPADPAGPMKLPRGWVTFKEAPGAPRVAIEFASDDPSRERGLMYVTHMPEDQGMIFTWPDEAERSFWMHDTCIPLDMLYIAADRTIVGVLEQVPAMDETPRAVPCPVAYVLELNAGWVRAHGVAPGQRIEIEK